MSTKYRKTPVALAAAVAVTALYGSVTYAESDYHKDSTTQTEETISGVKSAVSRTGQSIDDVTITTTVKARLIDDKTIDADAINVDTANGVVTLTGNVASEDAKAQAARLASGVSGVSEIDNRLAVGMEPSVADKAAATVDDVTITSKVKTRLIEEDSLSAAGINVDTANQVVTLSGSVASADDRQVAEKIAEKVPGVKSVDNRLQIEKEQ